MTSEMEVLELYCIIKIFVIVLQLRPKKMHLKMRYGKIFKTNKSK